MKGFKRKICSALCCLSVLSSANKVESFSFKDACRLAQKVPDWFGKQSVLPNYVFGELGVLITLAADFGWWRNYFTVSGVRDKTLMAMLNLYGMISFFSACNDMFYSEDEESSKSNDRNGKEQKETKKDRIENSLKYKEKSTSKDESSS